MSIALDALQHCPLFAGFPEAALDEAARHARIRHFQPGEVIYEKGEPQTFLCVIARGMVRINSVNQEGRESVLIVFDQGAWVGDAVFAPGADRVYGATAHTQATLVELPGAYFRDLMSRYPQCYPVVLEGISRRLWSAMTVIQEDALRGTTVRIGRRLLFLCDMQRGGAEPGGPVTVRLTREHIANMMGMTRQGVHRTLKQFQREGLVELGYGQVTICSEDALRRYLDCCPD